MPSINPTSSPVAVLDALVAMLGLPKPVKTRSLRCKIYYARVLNNGGLGIGLLLDYMTAAITPEELRMVFETAAEFDRPVTVHVRRGLPGDPSGLEQVIAEAEATGAPTLICHITHSAMSGVAAWLEKIDAANARGANISTETLSWLAGGTSIAADVFQRRDWRAIFDIDYGDVQWIATGEWLTESSFKHYQATQPEGMVNHHYAKEAWLETALKWPGMMVSTDALPAMDLDQLTNPNIAGTFSQFLGRYVRERQVLELSNALRTHHAQTRAVVRGRCTGVSPKRSYPTRCRR